MLVAAVLAVALLSGPSGSRVRAGAPDPNFALAMPSAAAAPSAGATALAAAPAPARGRGPALALLRKGRPFNGDVRRLPRLRARPAPRSQGSESESRTASPLAVRLDAAAQTPGAGFAKRAKLSACVCARAPRALDLARFSHAVASSTIRKTASDTKRRVSREFGGGR